MNECKIIFSPIKDKLIVSKKTYKRNCHIRDNNYKTLHKYSHICLNCWKPTTRALKTRKQKIVKQIIINDEKWKKRNK